MFLARKITLSKWGELSTLLGPDSIPADAITVDLRTRQNRLSLWRCESINDSDIKDIALALASKNTYTSKIDIAWILEDDLTSDDQIIQRMSSDIPVQDLASKHVDLCEMNYKRLGRVADRLRIAITTGSYRRFRESEVITILKSAVSHNRLELTSLDENLRKKLTLSP